MPQTCRLGVSKSAVTGCKGGAEPSPDVLRSAAHAYHEFINVDTDELFRELKDVAYPLHRDNEEPKKRTPKRRT